MSLWSTITLTALLAYKVLLTSSFAISFPKKLIHVQNQCSLSWSIFKCDQH